MNRPLHGAFAPLAVLTCCGVWLLPSTSEAGETAPFHAALAVRWGDGAGSDAFRTDLTRSLADVLATRCFAGVAIADGESESPTAELAFTVVLSDVLDETSFDDSIAGALQPGEPSNELRRVARFEVNVDATLSARTSGAVVRRKRLFVNVSRRPIFVGEDPQAGARAEAIDRIANDLRKSLGCGGAKLERKIRDALGAAGPPASQPR